MPGLRTWSWLSVRVRRPRACCWRVLGPAGSGRSNVVAAVVLTRSFSYMPSMPWDYELVERSYER